MMRSLAHVAAAAVLALPAAVPAQQQPAAPDSATHPRTVHQAATNVGNETKRVAKRSAKAVKKGYKDTEAQARRTGRHLHRSVSKKERERQAAEPHQP